jgi:voltage-gated potassium channel
LRGHFVVCGWGRVGKAVATDLLDRGNQVVVVEQKEENSSAIRAEAQFGEKLFLITGDADNEGVLGGAALGAAAGLVACVGSDAENLYIALAARRCSPQIPVVVRASDEDAEKNLKAAQKQAILTRALNPYSAAGKALAEAVLAEQRVPGRSGATTG